MHTTTTTTYPLDQAQAPCPVWCASAAGHPYESESHDGLTFFRWHALEVGRVEAAGGDLSVELVAEEALIGSTVRVEPVSIQLFVDVRPGSRGAFLTAVSAGRVAALLTDAAARLRDVEAMNSPVDPRLVADGGQVVEVWHGQPEPAAAVFLGQVVDVDGPSAILSEEPVRNGSGRVVGTRYTVTVDAAEAIRASLRIEVEQ